MRLLSDHKLVDGITSGDGIPSSNGFFAVLVERPIVDSSSAIPVFEALKPIFLSRKSTFCSCDAGTILYLVYVVYDIAVIESPASNLHRMRMRYGLEAFDVDSVPNVQVNVPLEPDITVPTAHPGAAFLGTPDPP